MVGQVVAAVQGAHSHSLTRHLQQQAQTCLSLLEVWHTSRRMQSASVATGLFSVKFVTIHSKNGVDSDNSVCAVMLVANPRRGHKDKLWLHREATKAMTATEMHTNNSRMLAAATQSMK